MHRCLRRKSAFVALLVTCCSLSTGISAYADERALASSFSPEARAEALAAIPMERVDPRYRGAVQKVLSDVSVFRRLPTQVIDCDPDMFTFMAKNPEVLVEIWRELKITQVKLERIDQQSFRMTDGAGTTGTLTVVEQSCQGGAQNRLVMLADGAYEGKPFIHPVKAQCVLLLRSGSLVEHDGRTYVAARLDSFVHIDKASLEIFAKVLHPLVGKTADRNFSDTITFIGNFSKAAEMQPTRIEHLASSLKEVTPARQKELVRIAFDCADANRDKNLRQAAAISDDSNSSRR